MNVELDFESGMSITEQIIERTCLLISTGVLKPGDQLPTVRILATKLGINFNTVARSYRRLDELGIVSTQQGRGTYVVVSQSIKVSERIRQGSLDALGNRYLLDARRLGYSKSQAIANLRERSGRSRN